MSLRALFVIAVITAFVSVLLTDTTHGWSWIGGPAVAFGFIAISDLRKAVPSKTLALDAIKFAVILMVVTFPLALFTVAFLVWAL